MDYILFCHSQKAESQFYTSLNKRTYDDDYFSHIPSHSGSPTGPKKSKKNKLQYEDQKATNNEEETWIIKWKKTKAFSYLNQKTEEVALRILRAKEHISNILVQIRTLMFDHWQEELLGNIEAKELPSGQDYWGHRDFLVSEIDGYWNKRLRLAEKINRTFEEIIWKFLMSFTKVGFVNGFTYESRNAIDKIFRYVCIGRNDTFMRSMRTMTDYDWKYIRVHQLGYDYQVKDVKFNPRDKLKGARDRLLQILKGIAQCQYTACTNYVDSLIESDDFAEFGDSTPREVDSSQEDNNSTDRKMIIPAEDNNSTDRKMIIPAEDNNSTDRKMIIPTEENFRNDRHK
jgi:hypothetical protein